MVFLVSIVVIVTAIAVGKWLKRVSDDMNKVNEDLKQYIHEQKEKQKEG